MELIIPIVYYHGKKKWKLALLSDFFRDLPSEWRRYVPSYDLIFHNLREIPPDQIRQLRHGLLRAAMYIQRDYSDPESLKRNIIPILTSLQPYLERPGIKSIFVYWFYFLEVTYEELKEIENRIPIENQASMKSLYDQLIEKGFEQGIEKGIEKGIERGIERGIEKGIEQGIEKSILNAFDHGIDLPTIQVITGESLEKIKKVLLKHGRL